MNLVSNTLGANVDNNMICTLIPDKDVEIIDTSDMKIAHCMGCNQYWLKTPGICAIKDDYEGVLMFSWNVPANYAKKDISQRRCSVNVHAKA